MAIAPDQTSVQYEPEEPCPPLVALVVGLQGAALVLAPTVLIVAISIRASGLDDTYLTWGVFAALLINAATTALQAFQAWRFGGGHIVITGPTAQFMGSRWRRYLPLDRRPSPAFSPSASSFRWPWPGSCRPSAGS
ncbi:MAG: hypothetical protein OXS30_07410 [Chloroflexota bacterium]|nr:hypothetical protein [Chloroflexota bacterium]